MFEEITIGDGATLHRSEETGILYQGFKGGLAWPGSLPAFACIIGEEYGDENALCILRVLHETHEGNLESMAKMCATLQDLYPLDGWIVDHEGDKEGFTQFFHEFSDAQKRKDPKSKLSFSFQQPGLSPDFNLAIQRLRRRFQKNALTLPRDGILARRLEQVNQEDLGQQGLADRYPEIMALASIVCEFDLTAFSPSKPFKPKRPPSAMAA
jgi:hypothetical protein